MSARKLSHFVALIYMGLFCPCEAFSDNLTETQVIHGHLVKVEISKNQALAIQAVFDKANTNMIWFDFGGGVPKAVFQNQNFAHFLKIINDEFAINSKVYKAFIDIENLPQPNAAVHVVCNVPSRIDPQVNALESNVSIYCQVIDIEDMENHSDKTP